MAGFLVGSAIMTWLLCSALNAAIENAAIEGWMGRTNAFLTMVACVGVIAVLMALLAWHTFPRSTIAELALTAQQVTDTARTSCWVNGLLVLGYFGFQLRRFWEDD